jgi:sporulation protein YlmC with PRC-barrel domain
MRAEQLLNRRVRAKNGRVVGRIEELRVEARGNRYEVTAYVLGPGGLLERLAIIGHRLLGRRVHAVVARWDQVDLTQPERPRLTCDRAELRSE